MNVALIHTEGIAEIRLEPAIITGIDTTIKHLRMLAAGRLRLGEGGVSQQPG